MKHTPTPWTVHESEFTKIKDADSNTIATISYTHLTGRRAAGEAEANAEFIVRACNAHDGLIKSAKAISALLSRWRAYGLVGEVDANPIGRLILDHDKLHDLLRAAISKAEGDDQPNGGYDA